MLTGEDKRTRQGVEGEEIEVLLVTGKSILRSSCLRRISTRPHSPWRFFLETPTWTNRIYTSDFFPNDSQQVQIV